MNAVLRTQFGAVARRPARLLLSGLAVLVASFVVYASVLVQQITERSLLDGLSRTPAAVDVVVHDGTLTTADLTRIRQISGVVEAAGRVGVGGRIGAGYLQIAADPGLGPLSVIKVTAGRYPSGPAEIAVTPRTADRMGLRIGTTVRTVVRYDQDGKPLAPTLVTVVGTVQVKDDYGSLAYATQPVVTALAASDTLDQIDVHLAPGADRAAVRAQMAAIVRSAASQSAAASPSAADNPSAAGAPADAPPKIETGAAVRHEEARARAADLDDAFAAAGLFVAIAVAAAALVATSTFRIVFAQRLRQLALLRAIGAGRRSLSAALAAEGALTGLVAGLSGVLLALAAGHLVPAVLRVFGRPVAGPGLPVLPALGTVALAVVITTLAVAAPAVAAARVSPLEALRGAGTTGSRRDIGGPRRVTGLLLTAGAALLAGYVLRHLPGRDAVGYAARTNLLAVVASGAFAFFALVALGPVLLRPVLAVLGWPIRRAGSIGRLAAGGVGGAPRRAAAVTVVVALGVTLIAGVLVGGASIRILADRRAASSAPADFEMRAGAAGGTLPGAAIDEVRAHSELTHVSPYRRLTVRIGGQNELEVNDLDLAALPQLKKLDVRSGSLAGLAPGTMVISGFTADNTGLQVGDIAQVNNGQHTVRLTVAALLPGSAPLGSAIVVTPGDLTTLGADPGSYAGVLADAAATGESGRTGGQKALAEVGGEHGDDWIVDVLADQRDQINANLTVVLAIAIGLISLTVLIAVVGVGSTIALSVVERVREAGLLRAVGLSRGGLRLMLTTESALYGVIGAAIGLVLGVPYAWLAVRALGVNAPLTLPAGQLLAVFTVLVLLTALAGVLPARRAGRVSPVAAAGVE